MEGLGAGRPRPDDFLAQLARWAAAERVAGAVSERSRARALVEQSAATATFEGLMVDLAEAAAEVTVSLGGGLKLKGRLVGTARDFAVLEGRGSRPVLVRTEAITAVAPSSDAGAARRPGGRRRPPMELTLGAALDALAGEEAPVTVRSVGDAVSGSVVACGQDVLTLRADGAGRPPLYLPLATIGCVELR